MQCFSAVAFKQADLVSMHSFHWLINVLVFWLVVNCPIVSVGFHAGIWHKPILGRVKVWWPGFPWFREFRAVPSSGFQVVRVFSGGGSHVGMVVHATLLPTKLGGNVLIALLD